MTLCPCCAHLLLRHIRRQQVYWFCRQCWQEMPALIETPPMVPAAPALPASVRLFPFVQKYRSTLTLRSSLNQEERTPTRFNSPSATLRQGVKKCSLLPTESVA
ncbi:MAG: hypothetical protein DCF22_13195 [Leptolyngbya sp.]|nr:MAG: hypothetical protein DCF22_13195 [Leptolyngbya sp.]